MLIPNSQVPLPLFATVVAVAMACNPSDAAREADLAANPAEPSPVGEDNRREPEESSAAEDDRRDPEPGVMEPPSPEPCSIEVGCTDLVEILFQNDGEWASGLYRVEILLDDQPLLVCEGMLPTGLPPGTIADFCDGEREDRQTELLAMDGELEQIAIFSSPAEIRVSVFLDGVSIGESVFRPAYEVVRPCPPSCVYSGVLRMEVGGLPDETNVDAGGGADAG